MFQAKERFRIMVGNKCGFLLVAFFKSKLLSKRAKIRLRKCLRRVYCTVRVPDVDEINDWQYPKEIYVYYVYNLYIYKEGEYLYREYSVRKKEIVYEVTKRRSDETIPRKGRLSDTIFEIPIRVKYSKIKGKFTITRRTQKVNSPCCLVLPFDVNLFRRLADKKHTYWIPIIFLYSQCFIRSGIKDLYLIFPYTLRA